MPAYVYMLRCRDGSYYVGSAQTGLEKRLAQHEAGTYDGYTRLRRPLELVFNQAFETITDALAAERQLKGWRRAKKEALIRGEFHLLPDLSRGPRAADRRHKT